MPRASVLTAVPLNKFWPLPEHTTSSLLLVGETAIPVIDQRLKANSAHDSSRLLEVFLR